MCLLWLCPWRFASLLVCWFKQTIGRRWCQICYKYVYQGYFHGSPYVKMFVYPQSSVVLTRKFHLKSSSLQTWQKANIKIARKGFVSWTNTQYQKANKIYHMFNILIQMHLFCFCLLYLTAWYLIYFTLLPLFIYFQCIKCWSLLFKSTKWAFLTFKYKHLC